MKKNIIIIGAGTAGLIMANKLNQKLSKESWQITVIDRSEKHYYQPGFLFIPFGYYRAEQVIRQNRDFLPKNVSFILESVEKVDPPNNSLTLSSGNKLSYDILIVASGTDIRPKETEGMSGKNWYQTIFDFYTFEGATKLEQKLSTWQGGKLVVHVAELPIKCPVAPFEFLFLADEFFKNKKMRDKVELTYVVPSDTVFTKKIASKAISKVMDEKGITSITNFGTSHIDNDKSTLESYDGKSVSFDLLVTVPTNMGSDYIANSQMGNELQYIETDKHTLKAKNYNNIFALGDTTDLPSSKAGSVAHFEADILTQNILEFIKGKPLTHSFDGHSNCMIMTGRRKAMLIDFNYEVEPLYGNFPFSFGPLPLLKESYLNYLGKLLFRPIYFSRLLKDKYLPLPTNMPKAGKDFNSHLK